MKKIFFYLIMVFIVIFASAYFLINWPQKDAASKKTTYYLKSKELFYAYEVNEAKANALYLDKIIEATGEIGEILVNKDGDHLLILKGESDFFGVKCAMEEAQRRRIEALNEGDIVTIKGLCIGGGGGFDVEMINCMLIKEQE